MAQPLGDMGKEHIMFTKYTLAIALSVICSLSIVSTSQADWRWAPPKMKAHTVTYKCDNMQCLKKTYMKERKRLAKKIARYNKRRLREWKHWSVLPIADCTWYGESGRGPRFARIRYVTPNSAGSGAYGKYQMMSGTYHNQAKYHDWSALDQEIAGHKEFWAHGTAPWSNC